MSSSEETWEPQAQVITSYILSINDLDYPGKKTNSDQREFAELVNCISTMYETLP